jgi:mannitol/fructose-specific phosphotransferase system IIA component (Ntr-type)
MKVAELFYVEESNVCFLNPSTKEEAIIALVKSIRGEIDGKEGEVIEKILEREAIVPTAIGKSIAIPHGRCSFLEDFAVAIGIIREGGINWQAMDGEAVKIICLIAGPADKPREYLTFLSHITSVLKEDHHRHQILNGSDKKTIVNIFRSC